MFRTAAKSFVQQLINAGANLDVKMLAKLAMHQYNAQILDIILEKVGVNFKDRNDGTLLHIAADSGYLDAAKMLIDKESSLINSTDKYYQRPIHLAAEKGHHKVLVFLLDSRAKVNVLANYEYDDKNTLPSVSPLHLAACYGHVKCVELLLKHEADTDQQNKNGLMALHLAAYGGHLGMAKLLLEKRAYE